MGQWICAYTKTAGELHAAEGAQRLGFRTYTPIYLDERKTERFLFPRYLFVFIDEAWRALRSTFGIVKLLMEDDRPRIVSPRVMSYLRSCEDRDGYFRTPDRYRRGDEILIVRGPLGDRDNPIKARFEHMTNRERCWALLEMMNGLVSVELSVLDIEPA